MPDAVMLAAALAASVLGMAWLALAMETHWEQVRGTAPLPARTVRALRLSSRPPKAGAPLPAELADRLAAAASAGLSADITHDRWATLVDAVAFSPVRLTVQPAGVPAEVVRDGVRGQAQGPRQGRRHLPEAERRGHAHADERRGGPLGARRMSRR